MSFIGNLKTHSLSIIIPCYNERENISELKQKLLPILIRLSDLLSVELVLVDDGSTDATWETLIEAFGEPAGERISIRLERHSQNLGIGAALRTGITASRGGVIVTTDSDGTYDFGLIPELLERLDANTDIVTASPYHPLGGFMGVPPHRLILSRGSSLLYRLLVDRKIYTYTALFRAYRREVFERVAFASDGFLACAEILVKARLAGFRVEEFPAVLHVRKYGASKAKLVRTTIEHLQFLSRIPILRLARNGEKQGSRNTEISPAVTKEGSLK